jgi:hypothetical protein
MKKIIYITILFLFSISNSDINAQELPIDNETGLISFSEVVLISDTVSKEELFNNAKHTFVVIFKNSQKVIQEENMDNGVIVGKGNFSVYAKAFGISAPAGYVNFTMSIYCKDGRYKYILTNFIHDGAGSTMPSVGRLENEKPSSLSWTKKQWLDVKNQVYLDSQAIIKRIKVEMLKSSPKEEEW